MLNSAKHEIFPAYNSLTFISRKYNIIGNMSLQNAEFLDIFLTYEHLKFHAQLSIA